MSVNPIAKFKLALAEAESAGIELANAFSVATVDSEGRPSNRMVLLKDVDEHGFVFYTNLESAKAVDLEANPNAALCFWWNPLQQQIRVRGTVTVVDDAEADEYFATRPRGSQIGAWASKQSATLASRADLDNAAEEITAKYDGKDVPRPPFWSGYRLKPTHIEFWYGRQDRLHDRHLYTFADGTWQETRLSP